MASWRRSRRASAAEHRARTGAPTREAVMIRRRDFVMTGTALGGWAAMGLPRPAWAASAAQTAVDAAKEFAGTEISIVWEAGLQALDPQQLLRPEVEGAHRDRRQGDRGRHRAEMFTKILQEHRAGTGRLRRAQRDPVLDARSGPRRCARGSRPLRRQVRLPRGAAGDRARLPRQPDDGRRQDLRLPGRRRRLRHVLPHGRPGRSQDPGGLQGQVRQPTCRCRPRPGRSSIRSAR